MTHSYVCHDAFTRVPHIYQRDLDGTLRASAKQDRQASLGYLSHPTHALLDCLAEASLDALLPDLIHLLLSYVHTQ